LFRVSSPQKDGTRPGHFVAALFSLNPIMAWMAVMTKAELVGLIFHVSNESLLAGFKLQKTTRHSKEV